MKYGLIDWDRNEVDHQFSEGRAWVEFRKGEDPYLGVIDETGALVYQVNLDRIAGGARGFADVNIPNSLLTATFQDGVSYYGLTGTLSDYADPGFVIVDKDGNELFSSDDGDDATSLTMLGFGNGVFVVREYVTDYSHNDSFLYAIDSSGKKLTDEFPLTVGDVGVDREFVCYADGIFCDGHRILNVNDNVLLDVTSSSVAYGCAPVTSFYQGRAITRQGGVISMDDLKSEDALAEYAHSMERRSDGSSPVVFDRVSLEDVSCSWGEGLVYGTTYDHEYNVYSGWFDLSGSLAVPAPDFGEGITISWAGRFSGGYAPIEVTGRDGESYVTVVDKSGKMLFEPIKARLAYPVARESVGHDGYFGVGIVVEDADSRVYTVMDTNGEVYKVGVDDLSVLGKDTVLSVGIFGGYDELVSGGYLFDCDAQNKYEQYATARYVGIDAKTVIDVCYE